MRVIHYITLINHAKGCYVRIRWQRWHTVTHVILLCDILNTSTYSRFSSEGFPVDGQ